MKKYPRILVPVGSERAEQDCACSLELSDDDLRWRLSEAERKLASISKMLAEAGLTADTDDPEELARAAANFCKYSHHGADINK